MSDLSQRQRFTHEDLVDSTTHIRLLRFSPSQTNNIRLEIASFRLEESPEFSAVSYTWGTASDIQSVRINGAVCTVRASCYYAIWQTWTHHPEGWFWIDSLCINQQNELEKSQQVSMMWSIFSTAFRVLCCVGPPTDETPELVEIALQVLSLYPTGYRDEDCDAWLSSLGEASAARLCNAFRSFANRRYFSRLWVVQEIAAAQRVWVLVGEDFISWRALEVMCDLLANPMQRVSRQNSWASVESVFMTPLETVDLFTDEIPSDLGLAFTNFGSFGCSDPRDRLYGLLHLIDWSTLGTGMPMADYSLTSYDLALRMAPYIKLYRLEDMMIAFQIDAQHPEMKTSISRRLLTNESTQCGSDAELFKVTVYDPTDDTEPELESSDQETTFVKLFADVDGSLTAALSEGPSNVDSKPEVQTWDQFISLHPGVSEFLPLHRDIPKPVYTDSRLSAFLCAKAQPGDILAKVGSEIRGTLLVLRQTAAREGLCDVVGQGITMNNYALVRHATNGTFEATLRLDLTAEDALVLCGQDLLGRKPDDHLRTRRLATCPVLDFVGAASLIDQRSVDEPE